MSRGELIAALARVYGHAHGTVELQFGRGYEPRRTARSRFSSTSVR
ncbi:unnamed protein product [Gemmata obscuriglobus UQM 2246]|nr:unnamed protein product [Gemmata obscuriglobus UQM 2246]